MDLAKCGHKASISEVTPARARVMQLHEDAAFRQCFMQGERVGLVFRADPVSSNCLHDFYMISPMIFLKRTNPYT